MQCLGTLNYNKQTKQKKQLCAIKHTNSKGLDGRLVHNFLFKKKKTPIWKTSPSLLLSHTDLGPSMAELLDVIITLGKQPKNEISFEQSKLVVKIGDWHYYLLLPVLIRDDWMEMETTRRSLYRSQK